MLGQLSPLWIVNKMIDKANLFTLLIDPSKRHNHFVLGLSFLEDQIKASDVMDTVKVKHISSVELMLLEHNFLVDAIDILCLGCIGLLGEELMNVGREDGFLFVWTVVLLVQALPFLDLSERSEGNI